MKVGKKEIWEQNETSLKIASAKKQKRHKSMQTIVFPVKLRAGNQVVREEPQTQKRHRKVDRKAGKKTPGPQTIWDESPLGIAMVLFFEHLFLRLFVKA